MQSKPVDFMKDPDQRDVMRHVFQNAFGNPLVLDSVPTLSTMDANSWGVNGTDVYIKFGNNSGLKISGTSFT